MGLVKIKNTQRRAMRFINQDLLITSMLALTEKSNTDSQREQEQSQNISQNKEQKKSHKIPGMCKTH